MFGRASLIIELFSDQSQHLCGPCRTHTYCLFGPNAGAFGVSRDSGSVGTEGRDVHPEALSLSVLQPDLHLHIRQQRLQEKTGARLERAHCFWYKQVHWEKARDKTAAQFGARQYSEPVYNACFCSLVSLRTMHCCDYSSLPMHAGTDSGITAGAFPVKPKASALTCLGPSARLIMLSLSGPRESGVKEKVKLFTL